MAPGDYRAFSKGPSYTGHLVLESQAMPSLISSVLMVAYTFALVRFTAKEISQRSINLALAALAFVTVAVPVLVLLGPRGPVATITLLAVGKLLALGLAGYASRRTSPHLPELGRFRAAFLAVIGLAVAVSVPFAVSGGYAAFMLIPLGAVALQAVVGYFIAPKKGYQPENHRVHERRRVMAGMLLYQSATALPLFVTFGGFA